MKTIITEVPAITAKITKTTYACDICGFEAPMTQTIKHHEFEKHQVKARHTIDGIEFFWMDDRKDFDNLVDSDIYGRVDGKFSVAGWYGVKEDECDSHY